MTIDRRSLLVAGGSAGLIAALGATGLSSGSADAATVSAATRGSDSWTNHVRSVIAVTQPYPDGQKLSHVIVSYDAPISAWGLSTSTYAVADRTITAVWPSETADIGHRSRAGRGRHVVLQLSLDDAAASLWVALPRTGGGTGGPPGVGDSTPSYKVVPASASVSQTAAVYTSTGWRYTATAAALSNSQTENLVIDEFRQFSYTDRSTGRTLPYNLFVPRNYTRRKKYPLVLFMHDASVVAGGPLSPLAQGVGATVWATAQDQARHECFVVAPAFPEVVIGDDYQPSNYFDTAVDLIRWLPTQYSIDTRRLHTTGQSMGAMLSLGMNIRYPKLFASSYIVAGQWPGEQAAPLANKKMWVCVSQGDTKAFPGITSIVEEIEPLGAKVAEATWDGGADQAEFRRDVSAMEAERANFNFASFTPGTVPGSSAGGGSEHTGTWKVAYNIPGIRDWVMRQTL